jgi:glycosyltransferase involved in cell wall biosynthesis
MKKKILMLLDSEFPPDIRVENEAVSLIEVGFEVQVLCLTHSDKKKYEVYKSIIIRRFKIDRKLKNKLFGLYLVIPIYHNIWMKQIEKVLSGNQFDILHIHDLPFSDIGLKLKKKYNLKLVLDQHEFFSDWINKNRFMNTFPGKIVKKLSNWEKYEKLVLPQGDLIITVADPLRNVYITKMGISAEKIISIPNTPDSRTFNPENVRSEIVKKYENDFVIFYAGGLDSLRGIDVVIESLRNISAKIINVKFVFAGKIGKSYDPVKHTAKKGVTNLTEYLGYIDYELLPSYYAASDVCVFIPPSDRDEINKTIATKIYQFIQAEKPCIVGKAELMKRFVLENRTGFSIDENKPAEFAEAVIKIYNDPEIHKQISMNCKKIKDEYIWEKTVTPMINKYTE